MASASSQKALVVTAGSVNYFYDVIGYRLAEVFRNIGFSVDICMLEKIQPQPYDWSFLVNLSEIVTGSGDAARALSLVNAIKTCSVHTGVVLLEHAGTTWFTENVKLCRRTGIDVLVDLGFCPQRIPVNVKPA